MDTNVVKSPNDKNLYKAFTLDNGLKVLVISDVSLFDEKVKSTDHAADSGEESEDDEELSEGTAGMEVEECHDTEPSKKNKTKLAAAALCVSVGNFSDPEDLPGLAHFLEHMVFMGSEKYPKENAYDEFISMHGGSDNASTNTERTVYVMDVVPKHLKKALDIFANCLICPLLKPDSMDREIEAVDSEFSLYLPSDTERRLLVLQSLAKNGHPMSKFSCGNRKSLKEVPAEKGIDVIEAVRQFYKQYYSSHHMTLAVQSTESLETLEAWVREIFSVMPNNNLPPPSFDSLQEPFIEEKFCKLYKIVPVKEKHSLVITWVLPPCQKYYRIKPLGYIACLLTHEGKGSIIALLRKRSWAVRLTSDGSDGFERNSTCSLLNINVQLTEAGMDNIFEVLTIIFEYVTMLKMKGPQEYYYKEIQTIYEKDFLYKEQEEAFDYVEEIAEYMQLYPCTDYLTGHELYFEYNEKVIKDYLDAIEISKANIAILSPRYSKKNFNFEVEPWTQCNYVCEDIPQEWMMKWINSKDNSNLHLPEPNRFIATDFKLKNEESQNKYPYKVFENELGRLWFKEDVKFKVPKAYAYFHFISPVAKNSALNNAMQDLYLRILGQVLCEETYPAAFANVVQEIYATKEGFALEVHGFNDKLPLLLETVLDKIATFHVEEEMFENMKKYLKNVYYNDVLKPRNLCKNLESSLVQNIFWTTIEKRNALESVTREMLMQFVKAYPTQVFVDGLIQGNVTKEEALMMNRMVHEKLLTEHVNNNCLLDFGCLQLPFGQTFCCVMSYNKQDSNSYVTNYYQLSPRTLEGLAFTELLMEFMYEPCFDKLRTVEQLGYIVGCQKQVLWDSLGFNINIECQSTKFCSTYVDERIDKFLTGFLLEMANMTEEKFQTQLDSLIETKKCDYVNLKEEADRNWYLVKAHCNTFDLREKLVDFLQKVTWGDFKNWLNKELPEDRKKHRKLCVQVIGPYDEDLKARQSSEVADSKIAETSESSDQMHSLHFVTCPGKAKSATFISDIKEFKSSLPNYPKAQML